MKIFHSLITLSMFMTYEAKACDIQGNVLICKEGSPEPHDCTIEQANAVVLAFKNKYTCTMKTSSPEKKGRFNVTTNSMTWISEQIDSIFTESNSINSKRCEIKTPSQLECENIKAYKCDESQKDAVVTAHRYRCTKSKFKVNGQDTYIWKFTDSPDSSRSTSPISVVNLEGSLDKLEAAILEVRNALQERKRVR